jgi:1,4-dihydroxy-2-naphthoate octaprenyltransferase
MRVWRLVWVLFKTSRPSQLLLIVGVYLLGAKIVQEKGAEMTISTLVVGAVPLIAVAASVHYANEYADYETDALAHRTPFSGGSGALQRADAPRSIPLRAGIVALIGGALLTAVLALTGWLALPAVGVLAIIAVAGWQYSVGPLRLAWRGFGEVTNATLGGLALPVYGGAVLGGPLLAVALASVPFFLLVLLNLFATQWPDREADGAVGKDTLAVQWSPDRLRLVYGLVAVGAGVSLLVLHPTVLPTSVVLASLPVAPLVVWGWWGYTIRHVPWPTASAMVGLALFQFLGWCWVVQF